MSDDLINKGDFGDYKGAGEKKNDYLAVSYGLVIPTCL